MSSVREVLPGRDYFLPPSIQKKDPLTLTEEELVSMLAASPAPAGKTQQTSESIRKIISVFFIDSDSCSAL